MAATTPKERAFPIGFAEICAVQAYPYSAARPSAVAVSEANSDAPDVFDLKRSSVI